MPRSGPTTSWARRAALALTSLLLLTACSTEPDQTDPQPGATTAEPDDSTSPTEPAGTVAPLVVVASVSPIADLVARVGGERVDVRSLVPPGADAHTWSPRPRDAMRLSEADVFFGVGLGLNEFAVDLAERNLADGSPLVLLGEQALGDDDLVFDHTHDDGHTHDEDDPPSHSHGDDTHTHDDEDEPGRSPGSDDDQTPGPNPHVWTSLRNAAAMIDTILTTLSDLDPNGAADMRRRADDLREDLLRLDADIARAVDTIPMEHRVLVTYHDAWTYLARDHGLEFAVAVQMSDHSEPSAAEVRRLIDLIRALDVPAVFGSEVFPTPVLEVIAEESGAAYLDGLSDDILPGSPRDPEHSYTELMRRNAVIIVEGLGGDASELLQSMP